MITVMTQLLAKSESIIITVMSVMTQLLPTCWPSPNLEVNCASDLPLTRPGSSRLPVAIMSGTVTVPGPGPALAASEYAAVPVRHRDRRAASLSHGDRAQHLSGPGRSTLCWLTGR